MRTSSVRPRRPLGAVVAAVVLLLATACQGASTTPDGADEVPGDDGSATTGEPDPPDDGPDDGPADPPGDEGEDGAVAGTSDDATREDDEVDEDGAEAVAPDDGPLAFTARSLEGGEVDVAASSDGPVLLWMWAPW